MGAVSLNKRGGEGLYWAVAQHNILRMGAPYARKYATAQTHYLSSRQGNEALSQNPMGTSTKPSSSLRP
jgi:hypothetical protein